MQLRIHHRCNDNTTWYQVPLFSRLGYETKGYERVAPNRTKKNNHTSHFSKFKISISECTYYFLLLLMNTYTTLLFHCHIHHPLSLLSRIIAMKSSSQAQSNNNANASDSHKETRLADTLFNNKHTDNILTSDESKHGKSICNMKPFDSFGSDYDASVSSMSDSNLSDALHEVVVEDSEGKKNDPQCLLGEGLANCNLAEIEFSFRPEYLEVSNDKIAKPKKMYLSKRLGDKVSEERRNFLSSFAICFTHWFQKSFDWIDSFDSLVDIETASTRLPYDQRVYFKLQLD